MANEAKAGKEADDIDISRAVLVEFDNIVLGGREILFSSLKKALAAKKVTLTPALFSQYALRRPLREAINIILDKASDSKASADKIANEVEKDVMSGLAGASANAGKELKGILKAAKDQNVTVGVVSSLADADVKSVLGKLGLADLADMVIQDSNVYQVSSTTETWMKLAKHTSIAPVCCLATVTCATSCKAALAAGMRCIVVPDKYTAFQDFGGASYVTDSLAEVTKDMFELLEVGR